MYSRYCAYLETVDLNTFKRHPDYTAILEHVSQDLGNAYRSLLTTECKMSTDEIIAFCRLNDSIGSPHQVMIDGLPSPVSPTSLRYLYHAWLIRTHMQDLDTYVEIGGGYGGLCLALAYLKAPIKTYHIVDLDGALALARRYLAHHTLGFSVGFHSAETYGAGISGPVGMISNYCLSEISPEHRANYCRTLIPIAARGFLVWNHIPLESIGVPVTVCPERPMTGSGNLFVTFESPTPNQDRHRSV